MIRALVAEDSATARALLVGILRSDPEIEIAGEAVNGLEAVEMTKRLRPDVITMDIRMPLMDGLEATRRIMAEVPTPIVIVSAGLSAPDVAGSIDTLRIGALAVLEKPPSPTAAGFDQESRRLVATVKAMAQVKVIRHWTDRTSVEIVAPPIVRRTGRTRVVGIAASTGGPAALHLVLRALPADFPVPILVVQHIADGFVGGLADWLNTVSAVHVKVAEEGETIAPGVVYLAPDDRHLAVSERGVTLSEAPPVGGFRPSANVLFASIARVFGTSAVAVMLTGMGDDGVDGLRTMKSAGGTIVVQDEQSSVVFGMPKAAIAEGLADVILPLREMPAKLIGLL